MKKILMVLCACFALGFCLFAFAGCGNQNEDITEEPELDADYLMGDYTQQLITDGAEQYLGSVSIEKHGDSYKATVAEKEVVASDRYDEGYYIADRNLEHKFTFDDGSRIVRTSKRGDLEYVDSETFLTEGQDANALYNVYVIGDSIELMVYVEPTEMLY